MLHLWKASQYSSPHVAALHIFAAHYASGRNKNLSGGQRHVLPVSTTRGVPSTSTDLKEALCEKIPVYYDLLRNFRRQYGPATVSNITVENLYQGLNGVSTTVRETSENDPKHGIKYRGLTMSEVIALLPRRGASPSAEAVFWLLLTGDVPTQEQTASLVNDWTVRRQKRKDWWSGSGGGTVSSVLQSLPKTMSPLGRFSVALTVFDTGGRAKEAIKNNVQGHTFWEYTYEDCMELLAALPAIVGSVAKEQHAHNVDEKGDWVECLTKCLSNASNQSENQKKSLEDFLRLYVALNADEDGGVPGAHVTQILGASQLDPNEALAAGVLAYANEPKSGTMQQYVEFQTQLESAFGRGPKEESLKDYLASLIRKNRLVGYKKSDVVDPRHTILLNFVREHLPEDPRVKLSQIITRTLVTMMKTAKGKNIYPEQNSIAAPAFQFYGLSDMKFNQVLLCMSRALGAIASIIWTRAINAPVEHPMSKCTYTYLELLRGARKEPQRGKYVKRFKK